MVVITVRQAVHYQAECAEQGDEQEHRRQADEQSRLGNPAPIVIIATGWAIAAGVSTITEATWSP